MQQVSAIADDAPPVEMLAALFDARGWRVALRAEDELEGSITGAWTAYQIRAIWRESERTLQLLCLPEVKVPADRRAAAHELLALVNARLWLGHFDLWEGGILVFRHATLLGNEGCLSLSQAQTLIEVAVDECDRFYPAFQFVLWGDRSPADALDAALVDLEGEA